MSACVMLAWCILLAVVVLVGVTGTAGQAQANIRIASNSRSSSSSSNSNSSSEVTAVATALGPAARYVVQPGDTLAGIAARLAVRGGWPALYAANRPVIGPDPGVIRPGAVLVLPGEAVPGQYRVMAGDMLASIAAGLGVRGGWPALYAANRPVIGADPGVIRPGMVLRVPGPAAPSPAAANPGHPSPSPSPSPPAVAGGGHRPVPARTAAPGGAGMPRWLETVLLVAGLLVGLAFLAEPVLVLYRRRERRAARLSTATAGVGQGPSLSKGSGCGQGSGPGQRPGPGRPGAGKARVVLADFDRVVVTHSACDDTVYVLRPPGEDPAAILRAARLVLPEGPYEELADQLGVPASLPME